MSDEAKYQTVFNKLVQLTAAKWNLQTVLKYKENIISSSTRNISTPKRPDIYQHLKTVNVDTTPRRKRFLCSPTSPGIPEQSSLQVENNKYSIASDSLSSTFNELNLPKNSPNESNSNIRNSDASSISSQSDDAHFSDDNLMLVSTNVEDEASADTNPLADASNNEEDVLSPLNANLIASTRKKRVFRAFGER